MFCWYRSYLERHKPLREEREFWNSTHSLGSRETCQVHSALPTRQKITATFSLTRSFQKVTSDITQMAVLRRLNFWKSGSITVINASALQIIPQKHHLWRENALPPVGRMMDLGWRVYSGHGWPRKEVPCSGLHHSDFCFGDSPGLRIRCSGEAACSGDAQAH